MQKKVFAYFMNSNFHVKLLLHFNSKCKHCACNLIIKIVFILIKRYFQYSYDISDAEHVSKNYYIMGFKSKFNIFINLFMISI